MRELLWGYVRRRLSLFLLLALCWGIFAVLLSLYHLPIEGALYGCVLCLLSVSLYYGFRWLAYRRRHLLLMELLREDSLPLERLPEPLEPLEADYQQLLESTELHFRSAAAQQREFQRDMEDYYTLWAHQIKTPLSAIRLIADQEECFQSGELRAQLLKTEQYVDMVLAYVRTSADHTDFVLRACALPDLVRQSVRRLAPLFIRREVRLELDLPKSSAVTDEKWFCFALEQVLSNAVKYTPSGGVVSVAIQGAHIMVRDTGVGIPAEDLPRVFEKGFTGQNGRLDKRASGIGLYLTRNILLRLGHQISIASCPGAGTTVTLDLTARPVIPV